MAIRLKKGIGINLEKNNGTKLTQFCVGCKWGTVTEKKFEEVVVKEGFLGFRRKTELRPVTKELDVDFDLSCMLFDSQGRLIDYIFSPEYNTGGRFNGKLDTFDDALHHTGDNRVGGGDVDNEMITVDLNRLNPNVRSIVFFLNVYNTPVYAGDFSGVPYAYIRMFEPIMKPGIGRPVVTGVKETFGQYDISTKTECIGMRGLVLGKLYLTAGEWKFKAIGDSFPDPNIAHTMNRVMRDYSR